MKIFKAKTIIISIIAALVSFLILEFRKNLGDSLSVSRIAYLYTPLILAGLIIVYYYRTKKFIIQLLIGLFVYWVFMTGFELIAFKVWEINITPAGDTYTRYELNALYPGFGLFICGGIFIIMLVLANILAFAKIVSDRFYKKKILKR